MPLASYDRGIRMLRKIKGLAFAGLVVLTSAAQAQPAAAGAYPQRPIRMIAAQSAGSSLDTILPELPTIEEAGVPGYEYVSWNGVLAPAGTSRNVLNSVHAVMRKVAAMPEVKAQFATQGLAPSASESPDQMKRMIREDYARIGKVVKAAGIQPE